MAQHLHISEPTTLFPHLESNDLHTVKEFKALIQDNLTSARDPSFLNALVDFYIQTNSFQAQDVLAGLREPLDKPLLDKLNECMKSSHSRLPALTLISHIVRRQPSWLYKIVQAPLFASLVTCLKTDTNTMVLMCGVLTVTTLLPMIPSQVGPFLHDICEIFARLASWNVQKPGEVHDVYQLHLQAAVYALFHRLYGMYPWNFLEFLQSHFVDKEKEFNIAILPMLERVRMHPQLIIGRKAKETELSRWRKMEVHDILMECARVCLDTTESTRDDRSTCGLSFSESGMGVAHSIATRSNVSSSCKTASPANVLSSNDPQNLPASKQNTTSNLARKPDATSNLISSQAMLAAMWSPSVDCGLTTPPTSHPPSPGGGSMMDISLTSSLQMGYGDPSSSLTTPRDSPHSVISEDPSHRIFNISEGSTPNKSGRKSRGKVPGALPRHPQNILHRTASAPSTPGFDANAWLPASPIRKYSADRTVFNFGAAKASAQQHAAAKVADAAMRGASGRSRHTSGKGVEESVLEDSIEEEEKADGIKCPQRREEEMEEDQETSVSLKDLPNVIRHLSDGHPRSEDAINAEVSSIVNSPQRDVGAFMSKVIAGLHQHKDGIGEPSHYVLNSTPKYDVEKQCGQMTRGTAEGADDDMMAEKTASRTQPNDVMQGERVLDSVGVGVDIKVGRGCHGDSSQESVESSLKDARTVSQNLFGDKSTKSTTGDHLEELRNVVSVANSGEALAHCELPAQGSHPLLSRQGSVDQGFTPIRDYSIDSMESPYPSEMSSTAHQAYLSISHMLTLVFPPYVMYPPPSMGTATPSTQDKGDDMSLASSDILSHYTRPLHAEFSPAEILDRHISMSDEVHDKELSRLPLTSQKSVNWTHYGGSPPADEINLLKGQVQLLHNQLLYERHKREVHAGRNRRLLGKTHKAKAYEELNSAMKDQLRLQEKEILRLSAEARLLRKENRQLSEECSHKDAKFHHAVQKLESEKVHLTECNEELNKLLVSHRLEVDKVKKDLKSSSSTLFNMEQELASTKADIATNRHLKDEIGRLNKEILLLGEANFKYKELTEESKLSRALVEEEAKRTESLNKELTDCHDAVKQKSVQLEAAKARITELDALLSLKDHSIADQKRYLESVKSLANGRVEAMEAKYHSLKKVNQRLEAQILKLTKHISEQSNVRARELARQRSNPDGAQLEDSSGSSGILGSRSNSPQKAFDRRGSGGSQRSWTSDKSQRLDERRTPLGDEGDILSAPAKLGTSPGVQNTTPTSRHPLPTMQEGAEPLGQSGPKSMIKDSNAKHSTMLQSGNYSVNGKVKDLQSLAIRFSEGSPFQRVQSVSSAPTNFASGVASGRCRALEQDNASSAATSSGSHSCPEFDNLSQGASGNSQSTDKKIGQSLGEGDESQTVPESVEPESSQWTERMAVVENIGSGVGSQGIAALLELDTSVEEHTRLTHW